MPDYRTGRKRPVLPLGIPGRSDVARLIVWRLRTGPVPGPSPALPNNPGLRHSLRSLVIRLIFLQKINLTPRSLRSLAASGYVFVRARARARTNTYDYSILVNGQYARHSSGLGLISPSPSSLLAPLPPDTLLICPAVTEQPPPLRGGGCSARLGRIVRLTETARMLPHSCSSGLGARRPAAAAPQAARLHDPQSLP